MQPSIVIIVIYTSSKEKLLLRKIIVTLFSNLFIDGGTHTFILQFNLLYVCILFRCKNFVFRMLQNVILGESRAFAILIWKRSKHKIALHYAQILLTIYYLKVT